MSPRPSTCAGLTMTTGNPNRARRRASVSAACMALT